MLHNDFLADDIKKTKNIHKRLFLEKAKELFIENNPTEDLESGFTYDDPSLWNMIQEFEHSKKEWVIPKEVDSFEDIPSLLFDEDEYGVYFKIYNLKLDHSIFYYMYGQVDKWIVKVQEDLSIVIDLIKVSEYIPEILEIIRKSGSAPKAHSCLIQKFNISYNTADVILATKVHTLVSTLPETYIEESDFLSKTLEILGKLYLFDLKMK